MRRFRFSLQAALVVRERAVETAEVALRVVQQEWTANQSRQRELAEALQAAEAETTAGEVTAPDLLALQHYREATRRIQWRLAREATGIAQRLAERQRAMQAAERDRTLLVRLKEKALAQWQFEYEKEQQQLAEEAYLSRWNAR